MPDAWDSTDGQTQHLDENGNTVGAQIGVRVWRREWTVGMPGDLHQYVQWNNHEWGEAKPWLAIPLDAESLAGLRERIAESIFEATTYDDEARRLNDFESGKVADAILAALNLDGEAP
jgi:hypothetical protein